MPVTGFSRYLENGKLRRRHFSGILVNSGVQISGILVGICISTKGQNSSKISKRKQKFKNSRFRNIHFVELPKTGPN